MTLLSDHQLRMEAAMRYEQMSRFPEIQAERIAEHYLSHLSIAKQLDKMLTLTRYQRSKDAAQAIEYEIALIKTNHLYDLGIALEWPQRIMVSQLQDPNSFTP